MRILTVACLMSMLALQTGCSIIPKTTARKAAPPDQKASEQYLAARRLEGQGKFELARESYAELIVTYPKHAEYQHRLGVVCTQLQRFAEAERYYEKAHQLDPKNASVLSDMGYSYILRGDLPKAEDTLKEALHVKPGDKRATSNLALVKGMQNKIEESLKLLREVNDDAGALTDLAYIHRRRGEMELAEERYHDALSLDPKNKAAIEGLAEVEKQFQSGKRRIAKRSLDKEPGEFKSRIAINGEKSNDIVTASAEEDSISKVIKTAGFTQEESTDDREPRVLKDQDDEMDDLEEVAADELNELEDDEQPAARKVRQASLSSDNWDDEQTDSQKSKATKKSSSVVQAGFQFDDQNDPFAQPKRKPKSAPDASAWEDLKVDVSEAVSENDDADEEPATDMDADEAQ